MALRRTTVRAAVDPGRGVFMISVAAELAEMHPQTLRMYEARGLIEPQRSPKGTRLYSQADVDLLRRIQEMTVELGMNLAGVERVLAMEEQIGRMSARIEALERRNARLVRALDTVKRSDGVEVVRWVPPAGSEVIPARRASQRRG